MWQNINLNKNLLKEATILLFIIVVYSAKVWCLDRYPDCIGIWWDQWDAEVVGLYSKWMDGTLGLSDLFAPHNEHRIFLTRIYNLLLFHLKGDAWDLFLQLKINAVLHTLTLAILIYFLGKSLSLWLRCVLAGASILICVIPYGYENTFCGLNSNFYFLILSGILLMATISYLTGPAFYVCLTTCVLIVPFTMASGPLSLIAGLLVLGLQLFRNRHKSKVALATLMILIGAIAIITICSTPKVPYHQQFRPHSMIQFKDALFYAFSWPFPSSFWSAIVIMAPIIVYLFYFIKDFRNTTQSQNFLFSMIIWVFLLIGSLAYGRCVLVWMSRYKDVYALNSIISITTILFFIQNIQNQNHNNKLRRYFSIIGLGWISIILCGYLSIISDSLDGIDNVGDYIMHQKTSLASYLNNHDERHLYKSPILYQPYPDVDRLKWILSQPSYRSIVDPVLEEMKIYRSSL
jgi:hypothetical protein